MNRPNSLQAGTEAYVSQGFSTSALLASGTGWSPVVRLSCGMFSSTSGLYPWATRITPPTAPTVTTPMSADIGTSTLGAKSPLVENHYFISRICLTPGPQQELKNSLKNEFNQETSRKRDLWLWSLGPHSYFPVYYLKADLTRKLLLGTSIHPSKGPSLIQYVTRSSRSFSLVNGVQQDYSLSQKGQALTQPVLKGCLITLPTPWNWKDPVTAVHQSCFQGQHNPGIYKHCQEAECVFFPLCFT